MSHTRTAKDEPTRIPPTIVVRRICNARSRSRVSLGKRGEAGRQARTGDVAVFEKDDRMLSVTAIKMIVKRLPTDAEIGKQGQYSKQSSQPQGDGRRADVPTTGPQSERSIMKAPL